MNQRIFNRYQKFISRCKTRILPININYTERHHIIPKCLGGTNELFNLIILTPREHYIAHLLLAYAYPQNIAITFAFVQMANKNYKKMAACGITKEKILTSRLYQQLKGDLYNRLATARKGMVHCRDKDGNLCYVSSEEFKIRSDLIFHTKGKIYCLNIKNNQKVWISVEDFYSNDEYVIDMEKQQVWIINNETNQKLLVTKSEWKTIYKHKKMNIDGKVKPRSLFTMVKHFSEDDKKRRKQQKTFTVYDEKQQSFCKVTKETYDRNIHVTTTYNKVLARDKNNNHVVVSKEEFKNGEYVGHTKGMCKVLDKKTNTIKLVSKEEKQRCPERYEGHMKNRVNVVDISTGQRCTIYKHEFNRDLYCYLGDKRYLFKCIIKSSNKEKNINYYEYVLNKDLYQIKDFIKYNTVLKLIEEMK